MKFTVVWLSSAEQALARLWNGAADRADVAAAADTIDAALAHEPSSYGESRSGATRIASSPRLPLFMMLTKLTDW